MLAMPVAKSDASCAHHPRNAAGRRSERLTGLKRARYVDGSSDEGYDGREDVMEDEVWQGVEGASARASVPACVRGVTLTMAPPMSRFDPLRDGQSKAQVWRDTCA